MYVCVCIYDYIIWLRGGIYMLGSCGFDDGVSISVLQCDVPFLG